MTRRIVILSLWFGIIGIAFGETRGFDLNQIPDGYPDGRSEAPPGAYNTPFKYFKADSEKVYLLEKKVYGLAKMAKGDEVKQAIAAYYLENLTIGLLNQISEKEKKKNQAFEFEALKNRLRETYQKVRVFQERLYQAMLREVDVALPGPNGLQIRIQGQSADPLDVLYECNCRQDTIPTKEEQAAYYQKKLEKFLKGGGKLSELHVLDQKYLNALQGVTHQEYVERPNGEIWVTEGKAGHVLLAEGGAVRSAGQIVVSKSKNGKISLLIASNASGTYKPDILSVNRMVEHLEEKYGIDRNNVQITEGDPLGTQTVEVLMKARGDSPEKIEMMAKTLEKNANKFRLHPYPVFPKAKMEKCPLSQLGQQSQLAH